MTEHYLKIKEQYGFEPIELIDVLGFTNFRVNNFIKYILRRNFKGQFKSDLKKALNCISDDDVSMLRLMKDEREDREELSKMLNSLFKNDRTAWLIFDAALFQRDFERARDLINNEMEYDTKR